MSSLHDLEETEKKYLIKRYVVHAKYTQHVLARECIVEYL